MGRRTANVVTLALLVIFAAACLYIWDTRRRTEVTAEAACLQLGFDGQMEIDGERFCYVACPLDEAVHRECVPSAHQGWR